MANFSINNSTNTGYGGAQQAVSSTWKTMVCTANSSGSTTNFGSSTGGNNFMYRRGKWYDILVGTNGTPADNVLVFDAVRCTQGGSLVTTVTSVSSLFGLDPQDNYGYIAASCINSSTETLTAVYEPWYLGLNQRASYRWVAAPGSELLYPNVSSATAGNGLALRAYSPGSAYTGNATVTVLFNEQ